MTTMAYLNIPNSAYDLWNTALSSIQQHELKADVLLSKQHQEHKRSWELQEEASVSCEEIVQPGRFMKVYIPIHLNEIFLKSTDHNAIDQTICL